MVTLRPFEQSPRQEDEAEKNVNQVIAGAELQHARYIPQFLRSSPEHKHSENPQRQIDDAKDQAEAFCRGWRTRKSQINGYHARHEVNQIVRRPQMSSQQMRREKATDSDQQKDNAQKFANSLCHDFV